MVLVEALALSMVAGQIRRVGRKRLVVERAEEATLRLE
jgi:hypothetical protein